MAIGPPLTRAAVQTNTDLAALQNTAVPAPPETKTAIGTVLQAALQNIVMVTAPARAPPNTEMVIAQALLLKIKIKIGTDPVRQRIRTGIGQARVLNTVAHLLRLSIKMGKKVVAAAAVQSTVLAHRLTKMGRKVVVPPVSTRPRPKVTAVAAAAPSTGTAIAAAAVQVNTKVAAVPLMTRTGTETKVRIHPVGISTNPPPHPPRLNTGTKSTNLPTVATEKKT